MKMTPFEVVEAMYSARQRGDIDAVLALCADAIVYTVNNADPDQPGSGETIIGKGQCRSMFNVVEAIWEPLSISPGPLRPVGNTGAPNLPGGSAQLRCRVTFSMGHRASGQLLNGTKTHEWVVRDGKVTSLCETRDRNFIRAFLAMAACSTWEQPGPAMAGQPSGSSRASD
jgi:ketosteroid isomerase-like protein